MKINRVSKFISKIYTSVKNGLELNTDDNVPESPKLNVKKLDFS